MGFGRLRQGLEFKSLGVLLRNPAQVLAVESLAFMMV